jgi:hypothetical protein
VSEAAALQAAESSLDEFTTLVFVGVGNTLPHEVVPGRAYTEIVVEAVTRYEVGGEWFPVWGRYWYLPTTSRADLYMRGEATAADGWLDEVAFNYYRALLGEGTDNA